MLAAAAADFVVKGAHRRVETHRSDRRLAEGDFQILIAIFVMGLMTTFAPTIGGSRYQPAIGDKILIAFKTGNIPDLCQDAPAAYFADPRHRTDSLVIRKVRPVPVNLFFDLMNLAFQQAKLFDLKRSLQGGRWRKVFSKWLSRRFRSRNGYFGMGTLYLKNRLYKLSCTLHLHQTMRNRARSNSQSSR